MSNAAHFYCTPLQRLCTAPAHHEGIRNQGLLGQKWLDQYTLFVVFVIACPPPAASLQSSVALLVRSGSIWPSHPCARGGTSSNQLRVDYAKTKKQLNRNAFMHKAFEMIKTDGASNGKTVEKEWKVGTEKGTRHITVNREVAFLQSKGDLVGRFVGNFAHLVMK